MKKTLVLVLYTLSNLLFVNAYAGLEHGASENNDNTDNSVIIARINSDDIEVTVPSVIFTFTDTDIKLKFKNPQHTRLLYNNNKINVIINGEDTILFFTNGECTIKKRFTTSDKAITIYTEEFSYTHPVTPISLWYIILPIVLIIGIIFFIATRKKSKS